MMIQRGDARPVSWTFSSRQAAGQPRSSRHPFGKPLSVSNFRCHHAGVLSFNLYWGVDVVSGGQNILFSRRFPKSTWTSLLQDLEAEEVANAYANLKANAPKRNDQQPYLGGRNGYTSSSASTNRREEHFAVAMVNAQQRWPLLNSKTFELVDYQVPLKAKRSDRGIGKIDLFGLTEAGQAMVVELKVQGHRGGDGDAPPVALLEAIRYGAIVEANLDRLRQEFRTRFGRSMTRQPPILCVLGEEDWWKSWLSSHPDAADLIARKSSEFSNALGLPILFGSISSSEIEYGIDGKPPKFTNLPKITHRTAVPMSAGAHRIAHAPERTLASYERELQDAWSGYANQKDTIALDGLDRPGRPPVVRQGKDRSNLILPDNASIGDRIERYVPHGERHRHFRSFRSSQALAQSVFGAISAVGRLDLLASVRAECGRPAFIDDPSDAELEMEVNVETLGEPRPTQVDVWINTQNYHVAVECKFCETEFGQCSRVRSYPDQPALCDGSYSRQQGRASRCALSEIGVQYWKHVPQLFDWQTDSDIAECPMKCGYQLVRNIMAATVHEGEIARPERGHAIVVYDARNPNYLSCGHADNQYREVAGSCLRTGLLRRVSWQTIVEFLAPEQELAWLVEGLREKHGIIPSRAA